jgi:hypothetical protein
MFALAASAALHLAVLASVLLVHEPAVSPFSGSLVPVEVWSQPSAGTAAPADRPNAEKAVPETASGRAPHAAGKVARPSSAGLWSTVCDSFSAAARKAFGLPDCAAGKPPVLSEEEIARARAAGEKRLRDLAAKNGWRFVPSRPAFKNPKGMASAIPDYYARMGMQNPIPPRPGPFSPLSRLVDPDGDTGNE